MLQILQRIASTVFKLSWQRIMVIYLLEFDIEKSTGNPKCERRFFEQHKKRNGTLSFN